MHVRELISNLPDLQYQGDLDLPFSGFEFNPPTRRPPTGRFYVVRDSSWPLTRGDRKHPGPKRNERLIQRALDRGVSGVICSPEYQSSSAVEGRNVFFAPDTYTLARHMASVIRNSLTDQKVTAITGSVGKTTTKDMLLHALRGSEAGRLTSSPGNQNLYRTILRRLSQSSRFDHTVIEASSAAFQTFRETGFSIDPDVGIVTAITEAHLDYMASLENIAQVKADIFRSTAPGGTAIINLDTNRANLLVQRAADEGRQVVTYGESHEAMIRLTGWDALTRRATVKVGQERVDYVLGSEGKHNALNSLAVIGALRALDVNNWRSGVESLVHFNALKGRGETQQVQLPSGVSITLIDEAYNANSASIRSSVAALSQRPVPTGSRRVAVLGDALELGSQADRIHRDLADLILTTELDQVFLFGQHMEQLHEVLRARVSHVRHWADLQAMRNDLMDLLQPNDVVLMKASRSTGLEGYVKNLTTEQP